MTLILAVAGLGLYGDKKIVSSDGVKCEDIVKIAKNDHLAAGFAGDFHKILRAVEAVDQGEDDPNMLAQMGVDGMIMKDGRMLLIDSGKIWLRRKTCPFYATGTGYAEAMAYLSGLTHKTKKVTPRAVKQAYSYTAKVRDDCGKRFDFIPA